MGKRGSTRHSVKSRQDNVHSQLSQKRATARSTAASSSPSSSSSSASASSSPPDLPTAISDSELLLSRARYSDAAALLESAVVSYPSAAQLHDLLALSYVGMGQPDAALSHLLTATRMDAEGSGDRWMYLGQLRQARDALDAFEKGAAVYKRQKTELQQRMQDEDGDGDGDGDVDEAAGEDDSASAVVSSERLAALSASLSTAYVSMAELYVTDCCDELEAEQRCESLLAEAMAEWPHNADGAYQTANLRLIQGNDAEATEWLDKTLAILDTAYDPSRQSALSLLTASSAQSTAASASYELRLNVAKLAYELERYQQCARLIDALLEEDDQYIEVQHIAACAQLQCRRFATALQHAQSAIAMCRANGASDRRAAQQLKPVIAALTQITQQCEGKEDEVDDDEDGKEEDDDMDEDQGEQDGEDEDEQVAEEEEEDGGGSAAVGGEQSDSVLEDGGDSGVEDEEHDGHDRMSTAD